MDMDTTKKEALSPPIQPYSSTIHSTPTKIHQPDDQDMTMVCFFMPTPTKDDDTTSYNVASSPTPDPAYISFQNWISTPSKVLADLKGNREIQRIINSFQFSQNKTTQAEIFDPTIWKIES
eukprot:14150-Ditylum_brightwellii.AAC.1